MCAVTKTQNQLMEQSVTHFTEEAIAQGGEEMLSHHERIVLSERDFTAFVEAINNSVEPPSEQLLADVTAYKLRHAKNALTY